MSRPRCCRRVSASPLVTQFRPVGTPEANEEAVVLALDEYEAIRLADLDGLYHDAAASHMEVSRATFGRLLESAHRKVARALVHAMPLRIEGGPVRMGLPGASQCRLCQAHVQEGLLAPDHGTGCHQAPCCERRGRDSCPGDADSQECARIRQRKNCRHLAPAAARGLEP